MATQCSTFNNVFCKVFFSAYPPLLQRSQQPVYRLFSCSGVYLRAFFLSLVILGMFAGSARAAMVKDLYSQDIPVAGQGFQERAQAMTQAFSQVLVKVTGQPEVLDNKVVREALAKPKTYIRKFGFHTDETATQRQQYFEVTFDEQSVKRLLRRAGVAIWGQNRPSTLVWLAIEKAGKRGIISASANLPGVFYQHFGARGLPVLFPLMDFEDEASISAVDIWGGFSSKLQEASRRYGTQSILSGRLSAQNDHYTGRLNLIFRGVSQSVAINNLDASGVARLASDLVGKTLSAHYAIDASDASAKTRLVVENITNAQRYAELNKYLQRVTAIRDLQVHKVSGSNIELELIIDGSESQLADALALDRSLQPVAGSTAVKMIYRWTRATEDNNQ